MDNNASTEQVPLGLVVTQGILDAVKIAGAPNAQPKEPFMVVLDEMGYYMADSFADLKEALREMDGVPNATYLVDGEKVFVFSKLAQLVVDAGYVRGTKPDPALVAKLMPQAWVSAEEAVVSHGVVPEPYELHKTGADLRIRHRPFDALLPGVYADQSSAQKALAILLAGGVISGEGQFQYRGQSMTLQADFGLAELPLRPVLNVTPDQSARDCLVLPDFHEGLPPLSATTYASLVTARKEWLAEYTAAAALARARAHDLWVDCAGYGIGALNDPASIVPEYLEEEARELRRLYPELAMLNDGSLCDWFSSYSNDFLMVRSWTPSRDDDFLFCLMGALARGQVQLDHDTRDAGLMVGLGMLQGYSASEASAFGAKVSRYGAALRRMATHARDAVTFLAEDAAGEKRRGPRVSTFNDMFRMGRMFNSGAA